MSTNPSQAVTSWKVTTINHRDDRDPYGALLPDPEGNFVAFADYERLAGKNLVLRATVRMLNEDANRVPATTKQSHSDGKDARRLSRSKFLGALELAVHWRDKAQGYYEQGVAKGASEAEQHVLAARCAALTYCARQLEQLLGETPKD